jgi:hypothetical protein
MLNEKRRVVTNNNDNPARKNTSAIFSNLPLFLIEPLIDKKERMQLAIKNMMATVVNSSMIVLPAMFNNLSEVSTTKQSPSKLEDAFKIWGDLSFSSFIVIKLYQDILLRPSPNNPLLH